MTASEAIENKVKSNRPSASAFKQQRLLAWQPRPTPRTIIPLFLGIGILFIPIGIALLLVSNGITELVIDYTYCLDASKLPENITCASQLRNDTIDTTTETCICSRPFELDEDLKGNVYMYYGLSNFYQNHRRYGKSRDDDQLLGILSEKPSDRCTPFRYDGDEENEDNPGNPIAPCGAIANSLFSDTLSIKWNDMDNGNGIVVPLLNSDIAWPSDRASKFRNPSNLREELTEGGYVPPLAWTRSLVELDPDNESNNGFQNEDLIVWMRTAALPNFRKLYRRIDHSNEHFMGGLSRGNYTLEVEYQFPVTSFDGRKQMILTTTSVLGGKNSFLGIAYIVVGSVCLLMGFILLLIHFKYSKLRKAVVEEVTTK